jgi:hypothetical protein
MSSAPAAPAAPAAAAAAPLSEEDQCDALRARVAKQKALVRELKKSGGEFGPAVVELTALKKQLAEMAGSDVGQTFDVSRSLPRRVLESSSFILPAVLPSGSLSSQKFFPAFVSPRSSSQGFSRSFVGVFFPRAFSEFSRAFQVFLQSVSRVSAERCQGFSETPRQFFRSSPRSSSQRSFLPEVLPRGSPGVLSAFFPRAFQSSPELFKCSS